jgi:hypothetical protein
MAECNIKKKGLAGSDCPEVPVAIKGMIKTPVDFVIPKATLDQGAAAVITYLNTQALLGNVDKFPDFQALEDISQEQVYQDTIFSITPVKDGNYRFRPTIASSLCQHKAMFTHRSKNFRAFLYDDDGWLIGTEKENGDMRGWLGDLLHTEKMRFNNGTEASVSPLMVAFKNNKEWDRYGMMIDISQGLGDIYQLVDVTIEVLANPAPTASVIVVEVLTECDKIAVEGLELADFIVLDNAGVAIVVTAIEELSPGVYELTSTADFVDDSTVTLKPASTISAKPYAIYNDPVEFDVA